MATLREQVETALSVSPGGLSLQELISLTHSKLASHSKAILQTLNSLRRDNKIERTPDNMKWVLTTAPPHAQPKAKRVYRSIDDE